MFRVSQKGRGIDDADTLEGIRGSSGMSRRDGTMWTRPGRSRFRLGAYQPVVRAG